MSADESKTALIVIGNSITEGRLQMILRKRGWLSQVVTDGDKAVDEFVALRPDLVFLAVDIPTLDGHVAALEMRESDPKARIVFVSSRGRISLAEDAAYSAGAVGVLMTPLTDSSIEESWSSWMGKIPEAPGLTDLDALYPTIEEPEPAPLSPSVTWHASTTRGAYPANGKYRASTYLANRTSAHDHPNKKEAQRTLVNPNHPLTDSIRRSHRRSHYAGVLDLNSLIDQLTEMV